MTSRGDHPRLHQYLIGPSPARRQHSPVGLARHRPRGAARRCAGAGAGRGLWKKRRCARPFSSALCLAAGRGAHHARLPAARAALRAALAPAGGSTRAPSPTSSAAPRPPRPRQRRGFRPSLQRGGEPQHREHLLLQLHQPAGPGKTLSRLPGTCQIPELRRCFGPLGIDLGRPQGPGGTLVPFSFKAITALPELPHPSQPLSRTTPLHFAPPVAWSWAFLSFPRLWFPARSAVQAPCWASL